MTASLQSYSLIALVIYFLILMYVVYRNRQVKSMEEYFLAGRNLPFWALSLTFVASWWGAGAALVCADEAYREGLGAFWVQGMPVIFSTFLLLLMSRLVRRVGSFTQSQMLRTRYGGATAPLLTAVLILGFMIITAASQVVGIGLFLSTYLNISYEAGALIGTGMVLAYSLFGGFRGVVITDIVQFVFLTISVLVVFYFAYNLSGGWENIRLQSEIQGKADFFSFGAGAKKYIAYVITFGAAWMIQANVWQRLSAARHERDAKRMSVMSFFIYIPLYLLATLTGMMALGVFPEMPEGGIIPAMITLHIPPFAGALLFVGITSAIMSTMDSLLNTGALMITEDLYHRHLHPSATQKQLMRVSVLSTLFVTLIAILIAFKIRSILDVSWIAADLIATGVFCPLVLGFFWKRGTHTGAVTAITTGGLYCLYNLLPQFGVNLPRPWEPGSAAQVLIGMGLSLTTFIIISLLTRPHPEGQNDFAKRDSTALG